jgi:hypothetical protein
MLHSRRITRNQSNSKIVISVCRKVYEHITEIGATKIKCSSGGELSILPEEHTAYLFMLNRITYFLFLSSSKWDFLAGPNVILACITLNHEPHEGMERSLFSCS